MIKSKKQRNDATLKRIKNIESVVIQINENLSGRVQVLEKGTVDSLLTRLQTVENQISDEKRILSTTEASQLLGMAESYLYKLTAAKKIPHYKPNGRMIFFEKKELEEWLLRNPINGSNDAVESLKTHSNP